MPRSPKVERHHTIKLQLAYRHGVRVQATRQRDGDVLGCAMLCNAVNEQRVLRYVPWNGLVLEMRSRIRRSGSYSVGAVDIPRTMVRMAKHFNITLE